MDTMIMEFKCDLGRLEHELFILEGKGYSPENMKRVEEIKIEAFRIRNAIKNRKRQLGWRVA